MTDTETSAGPETEETIIAGFSGCLPLAPLDEAMMMTTGIVVAYLGNNHLPVADLPALIRSVYGAVRTVGEGVSYEPATAAAPLVPAVPVKKSVTPDHLVCLEDGKKFKSLKRHLRTRYDMTPEQYRIRWGLPADYPMVAPNYAAARSELAKNIGLGQQRRAVSAAEPMQAAA